MGGAVGGRDGRTVGVVVIVGAGVLVSGILVGKSVGGRLGASVGVLDVGVNVGEPVDGPGDGTGVLSSQGLTPPQSGQHWLPWLPALVHAVKQQ